MATATPEMDHGRDEMTARYSPAQASRRDAIAGLGAAWLMCMAPARRALAETRSTPAATLEPDVAVRDVVAPLSRPVPDSFAALMDYDPQADLNAVYFRSTVARAARIAPFAATQAHPALEMRPGLATLVTTNRTISRRAADDWRAVRQAEMPAGGVQVSRFLGVNDVVVQWSGTGIIPNPALTDVAHRNGALCLGTIFQPDARFYSGDDARLGAVARKLVGFARYFGFDGYFINHETRDRAARAKVVKLISAIRAAAIAGGMPDFMIQYYNGFTDVAGLFAGDPAADSVMLDQGWSGYGGPGMCCSGAAIEPREAARQAETLGHSRFDLYYGLQLYPGPGYVGVAAPSVVSPNDGAYAYGGLQTYSLDDGILNLYRARKAGNGAAFLPASADPPAIERLVYSGRTGNPALDNTPSAAQRALYARGRQYSERATTSGRAAGTHPDQADVPISYGLSNLIAERSVIGSLPFVTHFNLGEGQAFFIEGQQVGHRPWFNLGIQDILPTWQWWRAPFAGLTDRRREPAGLLEVEYDQSVAYDGGASLHVHGPLGKHNATRIHLFKTDIALPAAGGAYVELATRGRGSDRERSRLGLIFADQPETATWIPLGSGPSSDVDMWHIERIDLGDHVDRRIVALLLGFEASPKDASPIDIHFGRLAIFDTPPAPPPAPRGVTMDRRIVNPLTGAIGIALRWQGEGRFDIFALNGSKRTRIWIGRIDGSAFYSPTALPAGTGLAMVEVQAIEAGVRGGSAYTTV
ncbi:MAG: hypothetical protein PGN16_01890 [Sphingomonas phyllosphaerae]|uniref:endo-beta-N-acetylglucosaminidase n=1 Tax=Sphingomonas phyllosphaerae TaxID=257003 RepID=UPI002FF6671D